MEEKPCECCGVEAILFEINNKVVCGGCYEEIQGEREDTIQLVARKVAAKSAAK